MGDNDGDEGDFGDGGMDFFVLDGVGLWHRV